MHEKVVFGGRWSLFTVGAEARFYCIIPSTEALGVLLVAVFVRSER